MEVTDEQKDEIREDNHWRKQQERMRKKVEVGEGSNKCKESSGKVVDNGNKKYGRWRRKYYRETKLLQVRIENLSKKKFQHLCTEEPEDYDSQAENNDLQSGEELAMSSPMKNVVVRTIWGLLIPRTKRKTKLSLSSLTQKKQG